MENKRDRKAIFSQEPGFSERMSSVANTVGKGDISEQVTFIARLFAVAA
jgi:hypothetical protein